VVLAQPREVSEGTGDASNRWQVSKSCSLFSDFVVATSSATFEPIRRVEYAVVSPAARAGKSASAVNRLMTLVSKTGIGFRETMERTTWAQSYRIPLLFQYRLR
jgi:hypothetical protein